MNVELDNSSSSAYTSFLGTGKAVKWITILLSLNSKSSYSYRSILLVAPILRGPLLARAVHAPDDSEQSTGRAVTPAISHAAGKAAQGTASASQRGRSRKWRQGVFRNPEKTGRLRRVWVEPAPRVPPRGSGTSVVCCGEFPGQLDGASVNPLLGHFA